MEKALLALLLLLLCYNTKYIIINSENKQKTKINTSTLSQPNIHDENETKENVIKISSG
jgi:hypothetical protein